MNFDHSDKTKELLGKIQQFMDDHLYEGEKIYHEQHEALRAAETLGLWPAIFR